jgi:hypothetical protein
VVASMRLNASAVVDRGFSEFRTTCSKSTREHSGNIHRLAFDGSGSHKKATRFVLICALFIDPNVYCRVLRVSTYVIRHGAESDGRWRDQVGEHHHIGIFLVKPWIE